MTWTQHRYSLSNGHITLIVPWQQERQSPGYAVRYLNELERFVPKTKARRVCQICHRPISLHDKWFFNEENRAQHRDCRRPTEYP